MSFFDWLRSKWYGRRLYVPGRFETLASFDGSFSQVFQVRERKTGQIFALKLLDPSRVDDYRERFEDERLKLPTEAEILRQIEHTHVVPCFESGETSEEEPFLLLEWLPGKLLSHWLTDEDYVTRLQGHRIDMVRQLAAALDTVHRAGFLHRDLCTENVMIDLEGNDAVLFDFSLAVPNDPKFIRPGLRFVRADYMAPEMMMRSVDGVKLDMYAFGVTAYELITGRFPYFRTTDQTTVARAFRAPIDILEYAPRLDPRMAVAIMRCMLYDPKERMPSAKAFLEAIAEVDEEEHAPQPAAQPAASSQAPRRPKG